MSAISDVRVRHPRPGDAHTVVHLHPAGPDLDDVLANDGDAWVAHDDGTPVAYAAVEPVPGLEGVLDLQGFVAPDARRQGVGSRLLRHVLADVRARPGIRQLSVRLEYLDSPAGHFLRQHGFILEHTEWQMVLDGLDDLPSFRVPAGCRLQTFARSEAIRHFRHLYEQSFGGTPWYQPYTGDAEVSDGLARAADLLFVVCGGDPAGVVWARLRRPGVGEIEPIGVAQEFQGQGLGRALLLAGLHQLARRGANRVRLGVWQRNKRAIRLYESVGFRRSGRVFYLAYEIVS